MSSSNTEGYITELVIQNSIAMKVAMFQLHANTLLHEYCTIEFDKVMNNINYLFKHESIICGWHT